ncbi:hypothetical protein HB779_22905 (plasmid) [Phyllobacterium sp. 628]|uniref:helix-turn-helix transcriptional regulator n=1 Tax=Phyllobacterium sp. 628 TaxID=2718938 RepID=UPI0016622CB1|nr:hypothetical protein [Phyllobacterium sp. 628]QND54760.1 hypothetical protein HB779_22905 [Phyllobacterium sp. 628]
MSEPTLANVTDLIGKIYQAAYDPQYWKIAIEEMRELFNSSAACLTNHTNDKLKTWAYSANPDGGYLQKYVEQYTLANPLLDSLSTTSLKTVLYDGNLFDISEFRRSEFWNDWMKPQDMYAGLCCKIHQTRNSIMFVDVRRGSNQTDFDQKDVELLSLLIPHFERASQINDRMMVFNALDNTFSRLPFGAMLVSADLRILAINDLAQEWIDSSETEIKIRNGFLAARPSILNQIQNLAADACGLHINGVSGSGGHLVLESSSDCAHPTEYLIEVAPLFDAPFRETAGERCAMVMFKKMDMGNLAGFEEHIRSIFKLSRSEARLAVLLAAGSSLKDAAFQVGVKNSTTRTYLERLFRKTGTHQQSQLVALLKNVAPGLLKKAG